MFKRVVDAEQLKQTKWQSVYVCATYCVQFRLMCSTIILLLNLQSRQGLAHVIEVIIELKSILICQQQIITILPKSINFYLHSWSIWTEFPFIYSVYTIYESLRLRLHYNIFHIHSASCSYFWFLIFCLKWCVTIH